MSDREHEKEFEAYLARRSSLGADAGAGEGLEPPAELDRIVLMNAREAIRLHRPPPLFRSVRWALPVGLAATVVLSFAVLLHFGLLPQSARNEPQPMEAHLHTDALREQAPLPTMNAPPPPEARIDIPAAAARNELAKAAAAPRKKEFQSELRAADARAASAAAASAASTTESQVPAPVEADEARENQSITGSSAPSGVKTDRVSAQDPQEWLRRIAVLRAQGKNQDADREWQAFRKAWPDYPVEKEHTP